MNSTALVNQLLQQGIRILIEHHIVLDQRSLIWGFGESCRFFNSPLTNMVYILRFFVLFRWLQKFHPSDPNTMTIHTLEAIASSSGKQLTKPADLDWEHENVLINDDSNVLAIISQPLLLRHTPGDSSDNKWASVCQWWKRPGWTT